MNTHNLKIMMVKEFRQIRRDRRTLGLIIGMPVMMLIIFGFAVSREIRHLPLGVMDLDETSTSRRYISAYLAPGSFRKELSAKSAKSLIEALDDGTINAVLLIKKGFSKEIMRGETTEVELLIDGTDPQIAITALGNAKQITYAVGMELFEERMRRNPLPVPIAKDKPGALARYWYNPDLRKVNFYVPSLIGLIVTQVTLILTSLAIVREKELGSMELLLSSPLTPLELILGKIAPYILLAMVDVVLILLLARGVFQVPFNGSPPLFFLLSLLFVFASLSVGLTFSNFASNQQQALYMVMFYMVTNFLLSGFIFPVITMPKFMQYVTYIVPLKYYLNILRGIITKGVGLEVLAPDVIGLMIISALSVFLSIKTFKRTIA